MKYFVVYQCECDSAEIKPSRTEIDYPKGIRSLEDIEVIEDMITDTLPPATVKQFGRAMVKYWQRFEA